ncbi:tyrosine-type recombinase/integrase [Hydrogenimonas sp.]
MYRKKLIDLIEGEELFKLKQGDYELIFEYDTIEELKDILEATKATQEQINSTMQQYTTAQHTLEKGANKIPDSKGLRFNDLEIKFVEIKRKSGKVGKSTYKAYASTFKKLQEFFKKKHIDTLTVEDYEEFREYLAKKYKLKNKTINNHMVYVNTFLEFGVNRQLLKFNPVKALESLSEEVSEKENFTDEEIQKILTYDSPQPHKTFLEIAIYSGR